ncbi:MAG: glycosyltransferase family 39 protein, partial [Patescibacteria group bacterium]
MIHKHSKWFWSAILSFLVLFTLGAYFKVLRAEFVYDDFGFIVNNKDIQSFKPFSKFFLSPDIFTGSNYAAENAGGKNWRPVSSLAFAVEYRLFGTNSSGFHLISILLHLINIILVYLLIIKITSRKDIAIATASLWALHPALTEAVSWVSNQSSLIFLGFFLLATLALLKERFWVAYLFFGLSLLSKETALGGIFIIPFIFLMDSEWREKINFRKILINSYPFVLTGLVYFYVHYKILGVLGDHASRGSFFQNILLAPAVFYKYISLVFYPVELLLNYSNFPLPSGAGDPRVVMGILSVVFLAALFYLGLKKSWSGFVIGIAWFMAFLLPVLQIIPFQDIAGERFLYAPLVGFFLAITLGFERFSSYAKSRFSFNFSAAGKIIFILVLAAFFILTLNRNNDWLNSENLWLSVLKVDDRNQRAYENLTAYYLEKGSIDKLIEFSKRLLEINYKNRTGRLHLAIGYAINRRFKEAESIFTDLLKEDPNFGPARTNLQILKTNTGPLNDSSFVESTVGAPLVEGNIINSGIAGRIILSDGAPFEASLDVFRADEMSRPFISVRSDAQGKFQIPLKPAVYIVKPMDP